MDPAAHRLPETTRPTHYDLHLTASMERDTFDGEVTIELELTEATETIELHARDLDIQQATLTQRELAGACQVEMDPEGEVARLILPSTAQPGQATIELTYTGRIGQAMAGLYLSQAGDEACLVTQCEATDARAILPCFDEPAFKATWAWSITTEPGLQVLANAPMATQAPGDGSTTWRFEATRPMASYLIACAIGAFQATPELEMDGTPFQVWALGGREKLGVHARDFAARLLPWFEDYFDEPYPYQKYDQVAVPSFSFGAMENVGLVVFRSSLLLVDPGNASWDQLRNVDRVVAHEFAHMWFGNLVTMAWWDDLWLNEAFAEWIAHKAVDALEPGHQVWTTFQRRTDAAMDTDALAATHPIYHPVETPAEAMEMFDAITYGKGSAVMRMLEAFLGERAFRDGLRTYIEAFAEDNARGEDLWDHLAQASEHPVQEIMEAWITTPGHPRIHLDIADQEPGTTTLELTQTRHRSTPNAQPEGTTWAIPLVLRYADEAGVHEHRHLLTEAIGTLELETDGDLLWVHGNADGLGFYRVDHAPELRAGLVEAADALTPVERTSLMRDEWGLVEAGQRGVITFLELLDNLATGVDHHAVVEHTVARTRALERVLEGMDGEPGEAALEGLRAWTKERFLDGFQELGPRSQGDEDPATRKRRGTLLGALASIAQHEGAMDAAEAIAADERADPNRVEGDLADPAVTARAQLGDASTFEEHVRIYRERRDGEATPQQADRYLFSLVAARGPELVEATLELCFDGTVPKQSVGPMLTRMLHEPHAQKLAWEAIEDRWDWIRENLGDAWTTRIVEATGQLPPGTGEQATMFLEANLDGLAHEAFSRAREQLTQTAELRERILDDMAGWFEKRTT